MRRALKWICRNDLAILLVLWEVTAGVLVAVVLREVGVW